MKKYNSLCCAVVACLVSILTTVNTNAQHTAQTGKHQVRSVHTGKSYELLVLLPQNYSEADTVRYPVLYLLDGKYSFPMFQAIRAMMELGKEVRDLIIVGIDVSSESTEDWMASRHTDFTPSAQPQADTLWTKITKLPEGKLRSGGAEKFLQALQYELIPVIESRYKTTTDRGLYGHSLGGLFVSYCLMRSPGLFNRYSINSPSLWWNTNEMLLLQQEMAKRESGINARVFFSAGAYEGEMMLQPFRTFTKAINEHHYQNLQMSVRVFEEESHLSVVPFCSSKTLTVLYPFNEK
jgi:predicted alpha/beta superfamily hydrolase